MAKTTGATLEIFVPYSDSVRAAVAREQERGRAFGSARPWVATHVFLDTLPEVSSFIETLDFGAAREEFRRKAKKLDLAVGGDAFPVSIFAREKGVVLEVVAQRPKSANV